MTYSHAFAYQEAFETWQSTSWLNSDRTIKVIVCKRKRFRTDTKQQVSVTVLKRQGFKRVHVFNSKMEDQ